MTHHGRVPTPAVNRLPAFPAAATAAAAPAAAPAAATAAITAAAATPAAAAATVAATAAITATAAAVAAATAAGAPILTRPRFVHGDGAAGEVLAVHCGDGRLRLVIFHVHKTEALRTSGFGRRNRRFCRSPLGKRVL